jgi:hypothetical protein
MIMSVVAVADIEQQPIPASVEFRLYTFINYYLSSIQQGIQTAHIIPELFLANPDGAPHATLVDWAQNHKTIVVLNGGNRAEIEAGFRALWLGEERLQRLPFGYFEEDEPSLGGIMTGFGVILPKAIYDATRVKKPAFGTDPEMFRYENPENGTSAEYDENDPLYDFLTYKEGCSLAR